MIQKVQGKENAYDISNVSVLELKCFLTRYPGKVHCIICTQATKDKYFKNMRNVTVNSKVFLDNRIYINHFR